VPQPGIGGRLIIGSHFLTEGKGPKSFLPVKEIKGRGRTVWKYAA
jgi:hypothetical protein